MAKTYTHPWHRRRHYKLPAEMHRKVLHLLKSTPLADRAIARQCGVSNAFVRSVRRKHPELIRPEQKSRERTYPELQRGWHGSTFSAALFRESRMTPKKIEMLKKEIMKAPALSDFEKKLLVMRLVERRPLEAIAERYSRSNAGKAIRDAAKKISLLETIRRIRSS